MVPLVSPSARPQGQHSLTEAERFPSRSLLCTALEGQAEGAPRPASSTASALLCSADSSHGCSLAVRGLSVLPGSCRIPGKWSIHADRRPHPTCGLWAITPCSVKCLGKLGLSESRKDVESHGQPPRGPGRLGPCSQPNPIGPWPRTCLALGALGGASVMGLPADGSLPCPKGPLFLSPDSLGQCSPRSCPCILPAALPCWLPAFCFHSRSGHSAVSPLPPH